MAMRVRGNQVLSAVFPEVSCSITTGTEKGKCCICCGMCPTVILQGFFFMCKIAQTSESVHISAHILIFITQPALVLT